MDNYQYEEIQKRVKDCIKNKDKTVIFGCGAVAKLFYHALSDLNIKTEYFVVNDGHRKEPFLQGRKVYEVSEVIDTLDIGVVYYGISEKNELIVEKVNKKYQTGVVIYEDFEIVLCVLLEEFYRNYFTKNGIDILQEYLQIGNCKLVNPFMKEISFRLELLTPLRDIVLPIMLSDYNHIDEGTYEYDNIKIEEQQTIFDCGANVGVFSAVAASKGAEVYAFEPIGHVVEQLQETQILYPAQIHIIPYALSDKIGMEEFYVDEDFGEACTMCHVLSGKQSKKISIQTTTIDTFIKENRIKKVDFIKADIEGAERFMLQGAAETLRSMQPKLAIATYHLEDDVQVLEGIIRDINPKYVIKHKWKMLYAYVPLDEFL